MTWIVAGLIAGVGAFFADYVMWGKVFTGPEMHGFGTMPPTPDERKKMMLPAMLKSGALALVFGLLLACSYERLKGGLWVQGGGPLAGMEFATLLWLCTIALSTLGSGVWYDKVRPLLKATFWSWLVRMNVAGLIVDLLVAQARGSIRLELQLPVVRRIGRPDHWRRERDGAHDRSLQQSLHRSRNPAAHPVRARLLLLSGGRTRCRRTLRAHRPRPGAGHRNRLALLALYHLLQRHRRGDQPARARLRTRHARECRRRGGRNPGGARPRGAGESDPSARGRRQRIDRAGGCAQRTAVGRHARAGRERVHPHLRAAARPQPVRGRPLPARHQEGGELGSADRLRSPRSHRRQLRARMSAQRHPLRARLRNVGPAGVGPGVRGGRFPPGGVLHRRARPRHGAGGAWRRRCRFLQRTGHVEPQRAPLVAAA